MHHWRRREGGREENLEQKDARFGLFGGGLGEGPVFGLGADGDTGGEDGEGEEVVAHGENIFTDKSRLPAK